MRLKKRRGILWLLWALACGQPASAAPAEEKPRLVEVLRNVFSPDRKLLVTEVYLE